MNFPISVTLLTKNSQLYLKEVLSALQNFDEVLVCDTGSSDQTIAIAEQFSNVLIHRLDFNGFGPTHNHASSLAKNDWVLSIDSDEIMTEELVQEINQLKLARGCVYSFPRRNEYCGKWIKGCGWHPDRQIRLYHRMDTHFTNDQVHECIISGHLEHIHLKSPLRHYSYGSVDDFLRKMQSYSTLFAAQNRGIKKSSLGKALSHGWFAFFNSYILKKGLFGGRQGFEISFYNGATAFYKYLKLAEANRNLMNKK